MLESRGLETLGESLGAGVRGLVSELLLNLEQSVVLGNSLRSAGSTSLDLTGPQSNGQVGNVLRGGLTRSVGGHDTPVVGLGELNSLDRLGDGSDLVDLQQETVTGLLLNGSLDPLGVGHSQVITDDLNLVGLGEVGPSIPVVLVKGVFDRDDGVLLGETGVELSELRTREPLGLVRVLVLEVQVVLAVLVEFGRSNVESNGDLALVTSSLDGLHQELKGLLGTRDVGSETTLVTDVGGYDLKLLSAEFNMVTLIEYTYRQFRTSC